jgi:hypothetical protein
LNRRIEYVERLIDYDDLQLVDESPRNPGRVSVDDRVGGDQRARSLGVPCHPAAGPSDCTARTGVPIARGRVARPCAFPRCSRSASVTLRLLVEGDESVLVTCDRHADWMRACADEDAAVQFTGDVPGVPGERSTTGDMANLA